MDLQRELIESRKDKGGTGGWRASAASLALHGLLIGGIVFAGTQATHKVASEQPIAAFITQGAAPPPPAPPPPPPKASGAKATPRVQPKPVEIPPDTLIPPREIPKEIPKVELPPMKDLPVVDTPVEEVADAGAVDGGVAGGVAGGIIGGQIGGVVGGELGGVTGGELGGVVGGKVGGTGTGTEGTGTGGPEAPVVPEPPPPPPPPPVPSGPLRVGGDVKAPVVVDRSEPNYTEAARKARITGIVVVEAIIGKDGRVQDVKVVKPLPMGLSEEAEAAVKRWRFKPGTLNGQPVTTIFNLTVHFKIG